MESTNTNEWHDVWKDATEILPECSCSCIVLTANGKIFIAKYDDRDNKFHFPMGMYAEIQEVVYWISMPYYKKDIPHMAADMPIGVVYANLYNSFKSLKEEHKAVRKCNRALCERLVKAGCMTIEELKEITAGKLTTFTAKALCKFINKQ